MANYRGPSKTRRNQSSMTLVEQMIQNFMDESGFLTQEDIPSRISYFINDSGYMVSAPVTSVNSLTGAVVLSLFSGNYSDLVGKPTLFSGAYADLTGKPTIPTVRKMETFSGVTDASGNYTVTYSTPYPSVPHVSPQLTAGTAAQVVRVTSSTVNGFTVAVTNRASVTLLAVELLLASTTPVVGAAVSVAVLARS